VSVPDRCMVCPNEPLALKSFWMHPMVHQGDEAQMDARFGPLGDSANLAQDRHLVCAEHTTGSKIILDTHNTIPW
jgi:hypothetical protein